MGKILQQQRSNKLKSMIREKWWRLQRHEDQDNICAFE